MLEDGSKKMSLQISESQEKSRLLDTENKVMKERLENLTREHQEAVQDWVLRESELQQKIDSLAGEVFFLCSSFLLICFGTHQILFKKIQQRITIEKEDGIEQTSLRATIEEMGEELRTLRSANTSRDLDHKDLQENVSLSLNFTPPPLPLVDGSLTPPPLFDSTNLFVNASKLLKRFSKIVSNKNLLLLSKKAKVVPSMMKLMELG